MIARTWRSGPSPHIGTTIRGTTIRGTTIRGTTIRSTPSFAFLGLVTGLLLCATMASRAGETGAQGESRHAAFESLLQAHGSAGLMEKLDAVNHFFNELPQRSDRIVWGRDDHWATPSELLARGAGDCEDLAIGKYFALRRLGIPRSALHITYVRDVSRDSPHMVLVHRGPGAARVVLDSGRDSVMPRAKRAELVSIYSFNEDRVTVMAADGVEHSFPHAGRWRLRQWQALLHRARLAAHSPIGDTLLAQGPSSF